MRFLKLHRVLPVAIALAGMIGFSATPAMAGGNAPMNLSFQTSDGNSAGWVTGHKVAYLTIGPNSDPVNGFAVITVHHFDSDLPKAEPSYDVSTGYASGTPRIYIQMSDQHLIFIYPDDVLGAGNVEVHNGTPTTTEPYDQFVSDETGESVTGVFIVADTSQAFPYTALIDGFQYGGIDLIG